MKTQDKILMEEFEKFWKEFKDIDGSDYYPPHFRQITSFWLSKIKQERERVLEDVLEKIENKLIKGKKGFVDMTFERLGLIKIPVEDDRTIFFNKALEEVKAIINEVNK